MSNAKLYSVGKLIKQGTTSSLRTIVFYENAYKSFDMETKAEAVEYSGWYLKYHLTNNERKYVQIPNSQWTKWKGMHFFVSWE